MEKHAFDPACCLGERLQTLSRAELTALAETICRFTRMTARRSRRIWPPRCAAA